MIFLPPRALVVLPSLTQVAASAPRSRGFTPNFLTELLLKTTPWTLLSDKNLNNGWYLYVAYLQGAKGTSSIFPTNLFFFFFPF